MSEPSQPIAIAAELIDEILTQPSSNEFGGRTAEEIGRLETGASEAAVLDTVHGASDRVAPTEPAKGRSLKVPAKPRKGNSADTVALANPIRQLPLSRPKGKAEKRAAVRRSPRVSAPVSQAAMDIMDAQPLIAKPSEKPAKAVIAKMIDGAIAKSAVSLDQVAALTKSNAAAIAASGKILVGGLRDIANSCVADGRAAIGSLKDDAAQVVAFRSPRDLLAFNTRVLTLNVRAFLEFNSKNTSAIVELTKASSTPLSERFMAVTFSLGRR